ncbi:MAG: regulatory iron-sulfur-containing complex subunit RicT [Thermodesulfobacteriota bacterium]
MSDQLTELEPQEHPAEGVPQEFRIYCIRFRAGQPPFSASARIGNLRAGEVVMVQSDHGLEPGIVAGPGTLPPADAEEAKKFLHAVVRRANREETEKYRRLADGEKDAFAFCSDLIEKHQLQMKLISVERYFNGSKIIFYFTAENRVDFRELVKELVQEFRTRVEMRQIGVRHETKMIGGLGCCGRELCCSSYLANFAPVSIKMAKKQDLPLNPAKISGICNRLLCCLTYEYEIYHQAKKEMPRPGKMVTLDNRIYRVLQVNVLADTVTVVAPDNPDDFRVLAREDWSRATCEQPPKPQKKKKPREQ